MLNYVFVNKFCKCIFDEWKHELDEEAEIDGLFTRDMMTGKVNEHTAIMYADVFHRELQKKMLSDLAFIEMSGMKGIEYVEYELKPTSHS